MTFRLREYLRESVWVVPLRAAVDGRAPEAAGPDDRRRREERRAGGDRSA